MDIRTIEKPLNQFITNLGQSVHVDRIILYGSYPEGTATRQSDIDVAVVSEDFRRISSVQRLRILDQAARFIRPEIVAVGFTKNELAQAEPGTIVGSIKSMGVPWDLQ